MTGGAAREPRHGLDVLYAGRGEDVDHALENMTLTRPRLARVMGVGEAAVVADAHGNAGQRA